MAITRTVRFSATLWRYPGKGGWTFLTVPRRCAPPVTEPWGRTPVTATVNGTTWRTSVWTTKDGETLLAVPKKVRQDAKAGTRFTAVLVIPTY